MAEHQSKYSTWAVSRIEEEHALYGTARPIDHDNANPDHSVSARLEPLPIAPFFNNELNDMMPPNPSPAQSLPEANMDWDINQFFDFQNAALESPIHDPTLAEPVCHNGSGLDISPKPALNNFYISSKRPTPASKLKGQTDAFTAQNKVMTSTKRLAAVQPQYYQPDKHPDSYTSASRIRITPAPSVHSGAMTGTLAASVCYGTEAMGPGFHCFDWKDQEGKQQNQRPPMKFRKEISKKQREEAKEVREKGACLRCYSMKVKCSSGYPCKTCKTLFERAHSSRTLQWRACIESSLADINIFTYGFTRSGRAGLAPRRQGPGTRMSVAVVDMSFYNAILEVMDCEGESSLLSFLDSLYLDILRARSHLDGPETDTTHTFILEDRNPLHMLLHLNTIMVGSHFLGEKLVGYQDYLLHLRAISGSLAFEGLESCFERTALANSSITRLLALVVYISILLKQVFEVGEHSAVSRYVSGDETYKTMQDHLIEYLSCYLRKLSTNAFAPGTPFLTLVKKAPADFIHRASFWDKLSTVTGLSALQMLPEAHQPLKVGHILLDEEPLVNSVTEPDLGIVIGEERPGRCSQGNLEALDLVSTGVTWKQIVDTWLMSM